MIRNKNHPTLRRTDRRSLKRLVLFTCISLLLAACSSIDCPMNNMVHTKYLLAGDVTTLTDTLTISTDIQDGNDSVVINKQVNTDSLFLPISFQRPQDTFYFQIRRTSGIQSIDTITVHKDNRPHFESIDCSPTFFHTIQQVTTTHHAIDSVVINNPQVSYDATKAHFLIFFKSRVY